MTVKDGMILRHVMDSHMIIDVSGTFQGVMKLNETSAQIWEGVAAGKNIETIAEELACEFEVKPEKAREDIEKFCSAMIEQGFFEA